MMQIIALLGRPDAPSDGVQDYCEHLGRALAGHVAQFAIARVDWFGQGWFGALVKLWQSANQWRGKWVDFAIHGALVVTSRFSRRTIIRSRRPSP